MNEVSSEEKARLQRVKEFRPGSIVKEEEIMCKCEEKKNSLGIPQEEYEHLNKSFGEMQDRQPSREERKEFEEAFTNVVGEKEEAPNTGKFEIVWSRENIAEVLIVDGYESLATVLVEALFQSQLGKGKKCHANGKPFMEQPIITGGRECGPGGLAFQARKKILEALNCEDDERAIEDYLGAIVYTAALVLLRREK